MCAYNPFLSLQGVEVIGIGLLTEVQSLCGAEPNLGELRAWSQKRVANIVPGERVLGGHHDLAVHLDRE